MIDDRDATLLSLAQHLVDHAPPGAEREVARLKRDLAEGIVPSYFGLEFCRDDEDGKERASATLYLNEEGLDGSYGASRSEDAEGNVWHSYKVRAKVSWPSYGSDEVSVCQKRVALMAEVTRFAAEVERAFPQAYHSLYRTAAQRAEDKERAAQRKAQADVAKLISFRAKGMRVGQERLAETNGDDLVPGTYDVQLDAGRKYRAIVTAPRAFYFTRVA